MMKNKKNRSSRYQKFLQTKHVFVEDNQVYFKKDIQDPGIFDEPVIQWFPVNFQWTTIRS